MEVEDHPVDPAVAAIEHAVDFWTPMLVRMGVAIGLFDAYGDRTAFPRDIAVEIEADSGVIGRVVRALATSGLFVSAGDGRYTLTATGARLRRGVPGSLAGLAAFRPWEIHAWAEGLHSLRTGEAAFPVAHGQDNWSYLAAHPDVNELFDAQMQRRTSTFLDLGIDAYAWPDEGTIIDLGGGNGSLLARVLAPRPALHGVLVDQPHVIERAANVLAEAGVDERVQVVAGNLLTDDYPRGGDVYVMSSVLHDWDNQSARRILQRCRQAIDADARLAVFDFVLPQNDVWTLGKLVDLHMLILFGAQERTAQEWNALLASANFDITTIIPTPGLAWIDARPQPSQP